jgi:hypothetical protein
MRLWNATVRKEKDDYSASAIFITQDHSSSEGKTSGTISLKRMRITSEGKVLVQWKKELGTNDLAPNISQVTTKEFTLSAVQQQDIVQIYFLRSERPIW